MDLDSITISKDGSNYFLSFFLSEKVTSFGCITFKMPKEITGKI